MELQVHLQQPCEGVPPPGVSGRLSSGTCAFWATSSTSWNFSDTVRSSLAGSFSQRGERIFPLKFNSSEKLLTKQQEGSRPQGSVGHCGPCTVRGPGVKTSAGLGVESPLVPAALPQCRGRAGCGAPDGSRHNDRSRPWLIPMLCLVSIVPTHSLTGWETEAQVCVKFT